MKASRALTLLGSVALMAGGCGDSGKDGLGGAGTGSTSASTTSATTGSTTTSATGATSSSTGMTMNSGDCDTNADCPGGTCVELSPGGFRVCQAPVMEATACSSADDACCKSSECMAPMKCYAGPIFPYCGGAQMLPHNECATDLCTTGAQCQSNEVCAPAGTVGNKVAACVPGSCKLDTDCTAQAGGVCATVTDPCCNQVVGLFCIYPGVNCRSSADCDANEYCNVDVNGPTCQPGGPNCPL